MTNVNRYRIAVIWLCLLAVMCVSKQIMLASDHGPQPPIYTPGPTFPSPSVPSGGNSGGGGGGGWGQRCAAPQQSKVETSLHTNLPVGMMMLQAYWNPQQAYQCAVKPCAVAALVSFALGPAYFVGGCTGAAAVCLYDNVNWDTMTLGWFSGGTANKPTLLEHLSQ